MLNPLATMTYKGRPNISPASVARKAREKKEIQLSVKRKQDVMLRLHERVDHPNSHVRPRHSTSSSNLLQSQIHHYANDVIREMHEEHLHLWKQHTRSPQLFTIWW